MIHSLAAKLSTKKHVIWDWNGTLLDDMEIAVACMNSIRSEFGMTLIDAQGYLTNFGFPVREYYIKIGFPNDEEHFRLVSDLFIERYESFRKDAGLHDLHLELLEILRARGIQHSILSASRQDLLLKQVNDYDILDRFAHAFGIDNHYAASKVERGRELMNVILEDQQAVLLVGDTDHDLEVGYELGVDVLLLSSGHQSHSRLAEKHEMVLSAEDLRTLLDLLK